MTDEEVEIAKTINDLKQSLKEAQWAKVDAERDLLVLNILERSLKAEIEKLQQQMSNEPQF